MPSLQQYSKGYLEDWDRMAIHARWQGAIDRAARHSIANKARYKAVERAIGMPWALIAAWHFRESGGNFAGVLHNGEHIIGTGRKTRLVPAGRGPFSSWHEAAIDALRLKGLQNIKSWTPDVICYQSERFNGFGYRSAGKPRSPYLWSGTQIYTRGKYVADGVYSGSAVDAQIGCIPHYRRILELDEEAAVRRQVPGLGWLSKLKKGLQSLLAAVTGLFSAENLGLLKDWFHGPEGAILTPENFLYIALALGGVWLLATMADGVLANGNAPPDPADEGPQNGDVA